MSETTILRLNAATQEPEGVNSYPEYEALWVLRAIGALDGAEFGSTAWDAAEAATPVTVALIDTSVAWEHPCLGAIDKGRMVDFSVLPQGAFVVPEGDGLSPEEIQTRQQVVALGLGVTEGVTAVRPIFSGHGTAMAGLIAGAPAAIDLHVPARVRPGVATSTTASKRSVMLPYAGVNPFCKLVPISTTSDPDPSVLLAAFDYADAIGADVIVFATTLVPPVDPAALAQGGSTAALAADAQAALALNAQRQALADRITEIAQQRYIVCAAGNSGEETAAFPASLSKNDNKIISVGAITETNTRAPYSPKARVYGPSGDEPRLDRDEFRLDSFAYTSVTPPEQKGDATTEVSLFDLVSTDVPGRGGYNPSPFPFAPGQDSNVYLDIGSLFCRFSGTSGASAVVGGLIALALQTKGEGEITVPQVTETPALLKLQDLQGT